MLLSAASYYESSIADIILEFAQNVSGGNEWLTSLVRQKAVERQFHTLFDWNSSSPNKFFAHFGSSCKDETAAALRADPKLKEAAEAFMTICSQRNQAAHTNFVNFPVDSLTLDDLHTQFIKGLQFVEFVRSTLIPKTAVTSPPDNPDTGPTEETILENL